MKVWERIGMFVVGSLIFALACTGGDPTGGVADADPARDGSRLKARYLVGGDGAKQFQSWFDTERQESCTFVMSGGKWTCLPVADALHDGNTTTQLFSDALCRQPLPGNSFVSSRYGCDQEFRYHFNTERASCGVASITYEVFGLHPRIVGDVYTNYSGTCDQSFEDWYEIAERVPLTAFVSAELQAP